MSLEDWVNFDWVAREPSSADELKDLLSIVDRGLHDAAVEVISDDLRFIAAFNAALAAANMALRASGYRARTGAGHHMHVAESLELTIGAPAGVVRAMRLFSKKRNFTTYDAAGHLTKADVQAVIELAGTLREDVVSWIRRTRPELAPE